MWPTRLAASCVTTPGGAHVSPKQSSGKSAIARRDRSEPDWRLPARRVRHPKKFCTAPQENAACLKYRIFRALFARSRRKKANLVLSLPILRFRETKQNGSPRLSFFFLRRSFFGRRPAEGRRSATAATNAAE